MHVIADRTRDIRTVSRSHRLLTSLTRGSDGPAFALIEQLMFMAVAILSASEPEFEQLLVLACLFYQSVRLATFSGHADLLWPSVAYWSAIFYSIHRSNGPGVVWRFVLGIGTMFSGLVLKMVDTTGRGAWGTAAFHWATAIGWTFLWSWSQTLPRR